MGLLEDISYSSVVTDCQQFYLNRMVKNPASKVSEQVIKCQIAHTYLKQFSSI